MKLHQNKTKIHAVYKCGNYRSYDLSNFMSLNYQSI